MGDSITAAFMVPWIYRDFTLIRAMYKVVAGDSRFNPLRVTDSSLFFIY